MKVFNYIALAFSGGGFRAAGYTLGTLSLLERVGLLESVKAISSVSGGSITAVKYAQSQIDGKSFDEFFSEYYSFLKEDTLVDNALKNLGSFGVWNETLAKHKRANPINSFSIEYNNFTNHRTFKDLDEAIVKKSTHLERIIINATDFNNGLPFRFQNTGNNRFNFGNQKLPSEYDKYYEHIKLGDALAASSAFPGGFEPILFPHDYTEVEDENLDPISLMDGGIVDNQGTSSLLSGSAFSNKVDLFLVSDVSSPYMGKLKPTKRNWITSLISFVFSLPMLLLTLICVLWAFSLESRIVYSLFLIVFLILFTIQLVMFFISKKVKAITGSKHRLKFPSMSFGIFLLDRINSLIHMTSEVSLKGFRRVNANEIYTKYWDKTVSSMIYELRCDNEENKPENGTHWDLIKIELGEIPESIKDLSKQATQFGTTLWFNNKPEIKSPTVNTLIACGEVTACFNLLSFLIVHRKTEIKNEESIEYQLFDTLKECWDEFKLKPYELLLSRIKQQ